MLKSLQTAKSVFPKIQGLIAAPFTPYTPNGNTDLTKIPKYADFLHKNEIKGVFVCGTTGDGPSLSLNERKKLAETWMECGRDKFDYVMIHVGSSSLKESKHLATHAQQIGAYGVGCVPPFFLKNIPLDGIIQYLQAVADCCSEKPFYYYHFPNLTTVNYPATSIMKAGGHIPNLAGLKFTSTDLKDACAVANMEGGRFQVLGGFDDLYLARLGLGIGDACIGVTYNFVPKVAIRLLKAYDNGHIETARTQQWRLQQVAQINQKYSTGSACREFMEFIGMDLGPPRLPVTPITDEKRADMRRDLEDIGFFEWCK